MGDGLREIWRGVRAAFITAQEVCASVVIWTFLLPAWGYEFDPLLERIAKRMGERDDGRC